MKQPHMDSSSKYRHFKSDEWFRFYAPGVQKGVPRKLSKYIWTGWLEVFMVIISCVYTVRYRDTLFRQTVSIDNLALHVVRSHQHFPERPGAKDIDSDEEPVEVHKEGKENNGGLQPQNNEREQEEAKEF